MFIVCPSVAGTVQVCKLLSCLPVCVKERTWTDAGRGNSVDTEGMQLDTAEPETSSLNPGHSGQDNHVKFLKITTF